MTPALASLPVDAVASAPPVRYRLAVDADGPAIGALWKAADYGDLGVDWTRARVANGWLLAEREGVLLGAIQVFMGEPYAVLGDCVVHPDARARTYEGAGRFGNAGHVTLVLYAKAIDALKRAGAQVALGVTRKPGMMRLIGRYGGVPLGTCESYGKDLTR